MNRIAIMPNDKQYKLVTLFLFSLLLFNFPFLGLFNKNILIAGIPVLYLYVFFCWIIILFLTFWVQRKNRGKS